MLGGLVDYNELTASRLLLADFADKALERFYPDLGALIKLVLPKR